MWEVIFGASCQKTLTTLVVREKGQVSFDWGTVPYNSIKVVKKIDTNLLQAYKYGDEERSWLVTERTFYFDQVELGTIKEEKVYPLSKIDKAKAYETIRFHYNNENIT